MKKLGVVLLTLLMSVSMAEARYWHHGGSYWRRGYHHRDHIPVVVAAGVAGMAVGGYVVSNQYRNTFIQPNQYRNTVVQPNQYYPPEDEKQCFVMVSKSTGNVTKKCVNSSNNYEILYVD